MAQAICDLAVPLAAGNGGALMRSELRSLISTYIS
jgi:hypothetical protein